MRKYCSLHHCLLLLAFMAIHLFQVRLARLCRLQADKNDVYVLPKLLDEKVATLHLPVLGAALTVPIQEHTDSQSFEVEGPLCSCGAHCPYSGTHRTGFKVGGPLCSSLVRIKKILQVSRVRAPCARPALTVLTQEHTDFTGFKGEGPLCSSGAHCPYSGTRSFSRRQRGRPLQVRTLPVLSCKVQSRLLHLGTPSVLVHVPGAQMVAKRRLAEPCG